MRLAAAVLALLLAPALLAETVEGRAVIDKEGLPGCRVTLSGADLTRITTSNAEGRFAFLAIPPGAYTITVELAGLTTESREISVHDEVMTVEDIVLQVLPMPDDLTITCSLSLCSSERTSNPYDAVFCDDSNLTWALIDAMKGGDRSAMNLLQQRFETAVTYDERHTIANALLGHVADDRKYWNELATHAADALRFAYVDGDPTREFLAWCQERRIDPRPHRDVMVRALGLAGSDRRGASLIAAALRSSDRDLIEAAMTSLSESRNESYLPQIEAAIGRLPHPADTALLLVAFCSEAADRVALKFVAEAQYAYERGRFDCEAAH